MNIQPSQNEKSVREKLLKEYLNTPIYKEQILDNLELYLRPQRIFEMMVMYELYKKVVNIPGAIMEFGVRWGRHLSTLIAFRGYFEPYNFYREIIGFDTFEGFHNIREQDGNSERVFQGAMKVTSNYENYLKRILKLHEQELPLAHIDRSKIIKGDAGERLEEYLKENPQTIIALAYFDMDIYFPTKECLKLVMEHSTKGTIIAFDELLNADFPGETIACKELMKEHNIKLEKIAGTAYPSYFVVQ